MNNYKVYKYTFPNNKVYIGVTSLSLERRRDNGYAHNIPLRDAIRECGWRAIVKEIIKDGLSQEEAFAIEREMISRYNATDKAFGYNISFGGKSVFLGLKHTTQYKERMSELNKGKMFSDETLKRMKQARKKQYCAVIRTDESGAEKRYDCMNSAATEICGYTTNIGRACETGRQYKGFYWKRAE